MTAPATVHAVKPQRPSLAPRHWGGWLTVALLWLLGALARAPGLWLGHRLGDLARLVGARRRRIVARNLERCFPDWDDARRADVQRDHFRALGQAVIESAWCWSGRGRRVLDRTDISGLEHLEAARQREQGVLLITAHFTCLEVSGLVLAHHAPAMGVYRRLREPVLEWWHTRGRMRYADGMIEQKDVRSIIRYLRAGGIVWYAPDQDFGRDQSLFVPFFGIETATLLASHRLPRMTGCAVLFLVPRFDTGSGRWQVTFTPPLADFPGDEPTEDLARINGLIEQQVRRAPAQYWWVHRRFKSRPPGEAPFYH